MGMSSVSKDRARRLSVGKQTGSGKLTKKVLVSKGRLLGPDLESLPGDRAVSSQPISVDVRVRLQAIAIPEPAGGYSIVVPALPGCVTEADTIEEVTAHVIEAAEGWLDVAHDRYKGERLRGALE
jgi:predicted RNase H-like HicB family nuclease